MEHAGQPIVRIFSGKEFIPEGTMFIDLFVPFWGPNEGRFETMQPTRVARYVERHAEFLAMSGIEECDFVVFPVEYQLCTRPDRAAVLLKLAGLAREAGKPLVVFVGGDLDEPPPAGDFVFHTAPYRSKLPPRTFCMPPMLEDLAERYFGGVAPVRAKEDVPSVSFCGMALPLGLPPGKKWVKESLRVLGYRLGLVKGVPVGYAPRALAIRALERARGVRCDFVVRRHSLVQFRWGHLLAADDQGKVVSAAQANDQRADYVKNLTGSDYVLCVRGYGNYSLRLYECLCAGRIPIIVNTDIVLPFEDSIDWKRLGIWVEEGEIGRIGKIVAEFHRRQTAESFAALQRRAREVWREFISPEGFYAQAFRELRKDEG